MREIALKIGTPTPLTAIVTAPKEIDTNKPAIILLNSGIMHHVGACRFSVKLARALTKHGFLCVRFDLSGIGDSAPRGGSASFHETAIAETTEVMNYLEHKRGIRKFVSFGLCSGADASYDIALADERIVGIAQIDPYCYRSWSWYVKYYGPKLFKLDLWLNAIKVRLTSNGGFSGISDEVDEENLEMPSYVRDFPPKAEVEAGLRTLVERKVSIYCLFTNGQSEILNSAKQFRHSFSAIKFADLLSVDYQREMDHIITAPHMQEYAVKEISNWVSLNAEKKS